MARPRNPIPASTKELLILSDKTPSGLEWTLDKRNKTPGEPAGRYQPHTGFYGVPLEGKLYLAHRIVYYLRTGQDPLEHAVRHKEDNLDKDNRQDLILVKTYGGKPKRTSKELYKDPRHVMGHMFRYVQDIDKLSDKDLEKRYYYRGYPCAHGHTIRDMTYHWCYHCVRKIKSNMCGFDLSYLHHAYKVKYYYLWNDIKTKGFEYCWDNPKIQERICFPSYRSYKSKHKNENVGVKKLVYQCAWGDIGKLKVSSICMNPNCLNPLHMMSKMNINIPPASIIPFCTELDYAKIALSIHYEKKGYAIDVPTQKQLKKAITYPSLVEYPDE